MRAVTALLAAVILLGGCKQEPARSPDAGRTACQASTTSSVERKSGQSAAPTRTVQGRVTRQGGGPLPNVLVTAHVFDPEQPWTRSRCGSTSTSAAGTFSLGCSLAGNVSVFCSPPGFAPGGASAAPTGSDSNVLHADIVLAPSDRLTGMIVDETGRGIGEASITATCTDSDDSSPHSFRHCVTTSTLDGSFILETTKGSWAVRAHHPNYVPAGVDAQAPASTASITMKRSGAEVRGVLRDQGTSAPVADAEVTIMPTTDPSAPRTHGRTVYTARSQTTRTLSDGTFAFQRLAKGAYKFECGSDNYCLTPASNAFTIVLPEERSTATVELTTWPGICLSGTAYDLTTSRPLAGVSVKTEGLWKHRRSATTDKQGRYSIRNIPVHGKTGNDYSIWLDVTKPFYALQARRGMLKASVPVPDGQTEIVHDLHLKPYPTVTGKVVDTEGKPVPQAKVWFAQSWFGAERFGNTTVTGDDGAFSLIVKSYCSGNLRAAAVAHPKSPAYRVDVKDEPIGGMVLRLDASASVSGVVVDPDGKPAPGARVWGDYLLLGPNRHVDKESSGTVADANGEFMIADLPECEFRLFADAPGQSRGETQSSLLKSGEKRTGVRIPLGTSHFLAGRVLDRNGTPVSGAEVVVKLGPTSGGGGTSCRYRYSERDGRWRIDGIEPTGFEVFAKTSELQSPHVSGPHVDRADIELRLDRENSEKRQEPKRDKQYEGQAVDSKTGQPVSSMSIGFAEDTQSHAVKTDAARPGWFCVTGLSSGYQGPSVIVKAPGYASRQTEHLSPNTAPARITMGPPGHIVGQVTSGRARTPAADVSVRLYALGANESMASNNPDHCPVHSNTRTGADGRFRFDSLAPGKWVFSVQQQAPRRGIYRSVAVEHNDTADAGEINLPDDGTVRVQLVRVPGRKPVPGVDIKLYANITEARFARTDTEGRVVFDGVAPGHFSLITQGNVRWPAQELASGEAKDVVLETGSASLKGRVLMRGQPLSALVSLHAGGGRSRETRSGSDGHYQFDDLVPGAWTATVRYAPAGPATSRRHTFQCTVPESGVVEKNFDLPGAALTGRVVAVDGTPVRDAEVVLKGASNSMTGDNRLKRTTNANGTFLFECVVGGTHRLTAKAPDGRVGMRDDVDVQDGHDAGPVEITVGGGCALEVTVTAQATGKPVPGAKVSVYPARPRPGLRQPSYKGTTDSNGKMRLEGLEENDYTVFAFGTTPFQRCDDGRVQVTAQQPAEVSIAMIECGLLQWNIVAGDNTTTQPRYAEFVSAPPTAVGYGKQGSHTSVHDGRYYLAPGNYVIKAVLRDGREVQEPFEIRAGETVERNTRLE